MELKDFVLTTLKEIESALADAAQGKRYYEINSSYGDNTTSGIKFDLAVTSEIAEEKENGISGGLKIKVVSAEGQKATKLTASSGSTSRIEFSVQPRTQSADNGSSFYE